MLEEKKLSFLSYYYYSDTKQYLFSCMIFHGWRSRSLTSKAKQMLAQCWCPGAKSTGIKAVTTYMLTSLAQ